MNWNDTLFKIEDKNIYTLAQSWNAEENSLCLISKGINIIYKFRANNTNEYLRITHQNIRNYSALESALKFQKISLSNGEKNSQNCIDQLCLLNPTQRVIIYLYLIFLKKLKNI